MIHQGRERNRAKALNRLLGVVAVPSVEEVVHSAVEVVPLVGVALILLVEWEVWGVDRA